MDIEVFTTRRSPLLKDYSKNYEIAVNKNLLILKSKEINKPVEGRTNSGDVVFLDYLNPNATEFLKLLVINEKQYQYSNNRFLLYQNEPSHLCKGSCDREGNKVTLPFIPDNIDILKNTLPINAIQFQNNILLDTHNLYAFQEIKIYNTILRDVNVKRPLLFSRSGFPGFSQFSGKWLGFLPHSSDGLKHSLIQTMNFNVK